MFVPKFWSMQSLLNEIRSTKIDLVNEDLITNAINEKYPNHCIIGEESTGTGKPASLTNSPTWIIDPIDGKEISEIRFIR